jgi:autotransporter passenger strand-loop-strand repeat protein
MRTAWDVALTAAGVLPEEDMAPSAVTGITVAPGADQKLAVLSWDAAPADAEIGAYEVRLADGRTISTKNNSVTLKKLSAGRQTVTVVAVDKAKNRSEGVAFGFDVADITAPKTGKVMARQSSADTVELSMTGFSDNVGIAAYRVYLDGRLIGTTTASTFQYRKDNLAGKLAFSVTAVDAAGNESKAGKANVTIQDVTAPNQVTGIAVAPGAKENGATLSWNVPDDNVGVVAYEVRLGNGQTVNTKTNSVTLKKLSAGRQTVTVVAVDKAKNRSEGVAFGFDVADGTAPKTGKVAARQSSADTVELSMTGFSDNVGIAAYRVYLGGQLVGSTTASTFQYRKDNLAGKLAFSVTAVDAAGNESKAGKASVAIKDVTAPTQVTGVSAEISGKNAVIKWNAASDNVGVVAYDIVIDGKHFSSKTNSYVFKNVVPGVSYQVTVAAVDKAKNVGQPSTAFTFGAAAPVADVTPPSKVTGVNAVLSGTDATVSWQAATDNVGVVSYEITVNGRKYTSTNTSLTLKKLAAGTYDVTVRAVDAAGNVGTASDNYSFECASSAGPVGSSGSVRLHTDGVVVESASSMSGKSVASNQFLVAEKGGTLTDTVVNGGTLLVSNGATATGTIINSGQGSAANASFVTLTMKTGYLTVLDGGTTSDVTLSGGALIVRTSGSARNTQVFSGSVDVSSGGVVQATTVSAQDYIRVGNQGSALDTFLASGAHAVVYSGGLASGGRVSSGADLTVSSGGSVQNVRVFAGGSAYVSNGATVSDLELVGDYVKLQLGIDSTTNVHFISSGVAHSVVNGVLSDVTAHRYTYFEVSEGGLVKDVRLGIFNTSFGGAAEIFSGGRVESITNRNYGQINVFPGGFLSSASTDTNAEIYLYGGDAANLRADSEGYIWIHSGSIASKVDVTSNGELTVSSGGSAAEVAIWTGGHAMVEERNAFMTDVDIHSSGILEVCGGNASGITVREGGLLTFSSGFVIMDGPWKESLNGQAVDVVLSGGTMAARYTGSAHNVTALPGAEIQVSSGSLVHELTLASGAYTVVNSDGVLADADIISGAQLDLCGGASASDLRIDSGVYVYLQYAPGMELAGSVDGTPFAVQDSVLSGYTQNTGVLDMVSGAAGSDLHISATGRLNISGGASADGVEIASGGLCHIYGDAMNLETSGEVHISGSVSGMEINGDYTQIHAGGVVTGVTLNAGGLLVHSGGGVNDLVVSDGGTMAVRDTGSASLVTALPGAKIQVSSGALVRELTLFSGAYTVVNSGALAGADIISGAQLDIMVGASASELRIDSGASVYLQYAPGMELAGSVDGTAFAVQNSVLSGYTQNKGVLDIASGAAGCDLHISAAGRLNVSGGASADGVEIASGGLCHIYGDAMNLKTSGEVHVTGNVAGMEINGDYTHIHAGGVATGVTLNAGGMLVYSGGRVNDLVMAGDGAASINAGAEICGLRAAGESYKLTLNSGSLLTGNISLEQTRIMVRSGARIDFDLTGLRMATDTPLIAGFEYVSGDRADYTISVTADQAPGTYVLASCFDTFRRFDSDAWLLIDGDDAGVLNLGTASSLLTDDRCYSLSQAEDGALLLDIAAVESAASAPADDLCGWPAVSGVDFAESAVATDEIFTSLSDIVESPRTALLTVR